MSYSSLLEQSEGPDEQVEGSNEKGKAILQQGEEVEAIDHPIEDETVVPGNEPKHAIEGPPERSKRKTILVIVAILGNEFCERLAFYSIIANLLLFLEGPKLEFSTPVAAGLVLLFEGTAYFTPVLGGYMADTYWGRFKAILIFIAIYALGMLMLLLTAIPALTNRPMAFVSLIVIALGTGGIKPNVSSFGADQFASSSTPGKSSSSMKTDGLLQPREESDSVVVSSVPVELDSESVLEDQATATIPKKTLLPQAKETHPDEKDLKDMQTRFFNWFYWSINLGSLIAFTGVAWVQQNLGFVYGLAIPFCALILAIAMFLLGSRSYHKNRPSGSVVSKTIVLIWHALPCRRSETPATVRHWLDRAKLACMSDGTRRFTDVEVEDVKTFLRTLPVQAMFVAYWCLYNQMSSVFYAQGKVMNLQLGSFMLPVACLNLFDCISILILVPVFERVVYPLLRRLGRRPTMLQRIACGHFVAALGVLSAGIIEAVRLRQYHQGNTITQVIGGEEVIAVDMSIFWQIPQFAIIGVSEVLASITGLEFAYSQSPESMTSMVMAIFLVTTSLGNYLGVGVIAIINGITYKNKWVKDDVNEGHLDYYFFFLTGLGFVNFLVFLVVSRFYRYARPHLPEDSQIELAEVEKVEVSTEEVVLDSLPVEKDCSPALKDRNSSFADDQERSISSLVVEAEESAPVHT